MSGGAELERFRRHFPLPQVGRKGQARLAEATVAVVGCGATGGAVAEFLIRAGVGNLRAIDRDVVAFDNLHRQILFDESDAAEGRPKALAAMRALQAVNGAARIEGLAQNLDRTNFEMLLGQADLIVDGTDNIPTRYLINHYAVARGVPWIYLGVAGTEAAWMPILPGRGPCLRCVFPEPPPPGSLPTCDSVGVLGPVPAAAAAAVAVLALRILLGDPPVPRLATWDYWRGEGRSLRPLRRVECRACGPEADPDPPGLEPRVVELCGRGMHQIVPRSTDSLDLGRLARTLESVCEPGSLRSGAGVVQCRVDTIRLVVFPDGRALVEGAANEDEALAIFDRYIGS